MGKTAWQDKGLDDIGTFLPKSGAGSMPVREVLVQKRQSEVLTIGPRETVYDALSRMAEKNVGALVVVDGGRVVGVISERDYARKVILIGKASRETAVEKMQHRPATGRLKGLAEHLRKCPIQTRSLSQAGLIKSTF